MTEKEIGTLFLSLGILLSLAHASGYIFERLHQPRLIGEILAGIFIGPFVLGKLSPSVFNYLFDFGQTVNGTNKTAIVFGFIYWLGVLLLMFLSGSEVRNLLSKENRRPTAWLLGLGTPLPFFLVLGLGLLHLLPIDLLIGEKDVYLSTLLVLASAVAITSIPVISRIFNDLGIMKTRFAGLILGSAVLEDIALWGVLAIATSYAVSSTAGAANTMVIHTLLNLAYIALSLSVFPYLLSRLRKMRWNVLYKKSPVAYLIIILSFYSALAILMQTNMVFAAFLAGFGAVGGVKGKDRPHFKEALSTISTFSYAVFIPLYFAIIGYRLVFDGTFSISLLLVFLIGSSMLVFISNGLAAYFAGFRKLGIINISITMNARGGPGIVLASIAYEAGIISSSFYTTLVLSALLTSQLAGGWLRYVMNRKWPLLPTVKRSN